MVRPIRKKEKKDELIKVSGSQIFRSAWEGVWNWFSVQWMNPRYTLEWAHRLLSDGWSRNRRDRNKMELTAVICKGRWCPWLAWRERENSDLWGIRQCRFDSDMWYGNSFQVLSQSLKLTYKQEVLGTSAPMCVRKYGHLHYLLDI